MILLDVVIAVVATVAVTLLLTWVKRKRQAVPLGFWVDTMLAFGFVILMLLPLAMLTEAIMPVFGDVLVALLAAAILYVASIAVTIYGIGQSNSVDSPAAKFNT